jgi:hypothetical protein
MNRKFKIIIIFILFGIINCFSQDGNRLINNAEKLISKNKLNRALYNLQEAKKSDYGFCGNAWESANWEISYLKAIIYLKKNEYSKSLKELDSIGGCGFGGDCEKSDSLKVAVLIKMYGKEKISKLFLENTSFIRYKDSYFVGLQAINFMSINYIFRFTYIEDKNNKMQSRVEPIQIPFNELIKRYKFYELLI